MKEESKYATKLLHSFISNQYSKAIESLLSGYITVEDIEMYVDNENSITQRINCIRESQATKQLESKYKEIISGDKLPTDDFIERLQNELEILNAELVKLIRTDAFTPDDAKTKAEKIESLEKRMEFYKKLINDLILSKETFKPKRKPGRPKKGENICTKSKSQTE